MLIMDLMITHLTNLFKLNIINKYDFHISLNNLRNNKTKHIKELIQRFGFTSPHYIVELFLQNPILNEKLIDFIYLSFFIFRVQLIETETEINNIKELGLNLGQNPDDFIINSSYPYYTTSLYEKINGANIYINVKNQNQNKYLKLTGFFKHDNCDIFKKSPLFIDKYNRLIKMIGTEKNRLTTFKKAYLEQMPLVKFLSTPFTELTVYLIQQYNEMDNISMKTMQELIDIFNKNNIIKQYFIVVYLVLSNNKKNIHIANMLCDIIQEKYYTLGAFELINNFFYNFHWTIQSKLSKVIFNNKKQLDALNKISIDDVKYEEQIMLMPVDDIIKKKALMKLREMESNKESSSKAHYYLDGLLKIPFDIYKKHPLITFMDEFKTELNNIYKINLVTELEIDNFLNNNLTSETKIISSKSLNNLLELDSYDAFDNNSPIIDDVKQINNIKRVLIKSGIKNNIVDKYWNTNELDASSSVVNDDNNNDLLPNVKVNRSTLLNKWNLYKHNKIEYLKNVRTILDLSVFGHEKSKVMIQKIIAQWMNGIMKGNIIGMYGPPGIGKTTIIKNGLSKCLGDRPFEFVALGGKTHGSFLEGSNYTYVGSSWGKIVDMLIHSQCMNPIIYFDELDKMSNSEFGREIMNILIHITDPSQNKEFQDRYFNGINLDLSKILFVFSYNDRANIDRVLLDRITEIKVDSLKLEEKIIVARDYIMPEILTDTGYRAQDIIINDEIITYIIDNYTFESGVRKLKECLVEIIRDINLQRVQGKLEINDFPFNITIDFITELFKERPKAINRYINSQPEVGIINGMFANSLGLGGILQIECHKMLSNTGSKLSLELTGLPGDVMKDSIKVARTVAWNLLTADEKQLIENDTGLHIHLPEGATPKDGPSAGAALALVIISCILDKPINNTVAITGELELHGRITRIGGLEYKICGSVKAGVKTILIPVDNKEDLDLINPNVYKGTQIILVNNIKECLQYFFTPFAHLKTPN